MKHKLTLIFIRLTHIGLLSVLVLLVSFKVAQADSDDLIGMKLPLQSCSFSGAFTQIEIQKNTGNQTTSSGSIFYNCELGIIWRTEKTIISTKIITTKNLHYLLDEEDSIKPLDSIPDSLESKLLLSMLGGDDEFIGKHFNIEHDGQSHFTLMPKTNSYKRGLERIEFKINNDEKDQVTIKIIDRKSNETTMTINQDQIYTGEQSTYNVCQQLYTGTEYCSILKNPIHYQSIDH